MPVSTRGAVLGVSTALLLLSVTTGPAAAAAHAAMPSDFNGDGYADLAIGAPYEAIGARNRAGAVTVLYGSSTGIRATNAQRWTQDTPGVKGISRANERLGSALATADFDRDGYADLAIGVPKDNDTGERHAGAVSVLYGSSMGLSIHGDQLWSQVNLADHPEGSDHFGTSLATGDFDGDGYPDLAIGVPDERRDDSNRTGIVQVVFGSADGLRAARSSVLTHDLDGAPVASWARFGIDLAAGDFDANGIADLAASGESDGNGDIHVYDGLAGGLGPSERWSQDSPGVLDQDEPNDLFGAALEVGDFDDDGRDDLAVGVPYENVTTCPPDDACSQGAVAVLFGSSVGLTSDGNQLWHQDVPGIPGEALEGWFGGSLAHGDFDGDGYDDLAIGEPVEAESGAVIVLRGGADGLVATDAQRWTEDSPGVPGSRSEGSAFGWSLGAANYGKSDRDDLAIGNPFIGAGAVWVLYGRAGGLAATDCQRWTQESPGVPGSNGGQDEFGVTLTP